VRPALLALLLLAAPAGGAPTGSEESDAPAALSEAAPAAPRDAGEAEWRRRLDEILARREFRAGPRGSGLDPNLSTPEMTFLDWLVDHLKRAFERLLEWLRRSRRPPPGDPARPFASGLSEPLAWALAAGAAALLGLLLVRAWRRRRAAEPASLGATVAASAGAALPDALSQPADAWERFAQEFARSGEWRLALRALYLRLLALLHERGAIRYEIQRTNGDYVAALGGGAAAEPFRRVTLSFDQAWYGNKPFGREDYDAALRWTRAVDRATARAPAGAPGTTG
jgi:hypothetical protein